MSSERGQNEPRFDVNLENVNPENVRGQDSYETPPVQPLHQTRRRLLGAVVALAALAGFAGIAWYATNKGRQNPGAVVPVITADTSPIKERPVEPGGLKVPNRGMQVFERITPGAQPRKVERLLPPAEKPMARPAAPPPTSPPAGPLVPKAPAIETRPSTPAPPATTKSSVAERTTPSKAPLSPPKTATGGGWQIQLGATRSAARAKAAATRLAGIHKDVLGSLNINIVRADLGKRGVYFRMRAGPFANRTAASAVCRKLAARKVGCIIVKP